MTIAELLATSGIPKADGEILIAFVMGRPRAWVFAHPEEQVSEPHRIECLDAIHRRREGEPVAYITGEKEFFGRTFAVDRRVLIPRPSTEGLVDLLLSLYKKSVQLEAERWHTLPLDEDIVAAVWLRGDALPPFIVDVGTGSGCIALTMAAERPGVSVLATDVSSDALEIARMNADRLHLRDRVRFALADGPAAFADLTVPFVVVSNPPYIPAGVTLERDVADYEPHGALFAGSDGMDVLRPLVDAAMTHPLCTAILLECRTEQARHIAGD